MQYKNYAKKPLDERGLSLLKEKEFLEIEIKNKESILNKGIYKKDFSKGNGSSSMKWANLDKILAFDLFCAILYFLAIILSIYAMTIVPEIAIIVIPVDILVAIVDFYLFVQFIIRHKKREIRELKRKLYDINTQLDFYDLNIE